MTVIITVSATIFAALFFVMSDRKANIPNDALVVGNGYMRVWKEEDRINFVFRNRPHHTVKFDVKIADELSEAIRGLA